MKESKEITEVKMDSLNNLADSLIVKIKQI